MGGRRVGLVRAAGGVVLRRGALGGLEVALVHRPAYDDWSFPKGKLLPGEGEEDAAPREVEEETGLRCRLERRLPPVRYRDRKGRTKVVTYWTMTPVSGSFHATDEVDELRWVPVKDAPSLLTHDTDREVLRAALASR